MSAYQELFNERFLFSCKEHRTESLENIECIGHIEYCKVNGRRIGLEPVGYNRCIIRTFVQLY